MNTFIVMKFGGTSVKDAPAIARVTELVRSRLQSPCGAAQACKPVVVVSALAKVTDALYKMATVAAQGNYLGAKTLLDEIAWRHSALAEELIPDSPLRDETNAAIDGIVVYLDRMLQGISFLGELSDKSYASIVSCGELLSSHIIARVLNHRGIHTLWADARKFMVTDDVYMKGTPLMDELSPRVQTHLAAPAEGYEAVITQGFVAANLAGHTTVLGRGGSDYSASLIGMALDARAIEIWTDVDGILTADPRVVPAPRRIPVLSFDEAAELAHFGAKVLHPATIQPAVKKNIPVRVLNSANPACEGTLIVENPQEGEGPKSISSKEQIIVVNIYTARMINTSGFLARIFECFSQYGLSVDIISTSEANVSLTIEQTPPQALLDELNAFSTVTVTTGKSQVSVVGNSLQSIPGFTERLFSSLSAYHIDMISQGASSINVSLVVDRQDLYEIVRSLHQSLFEA